MNPGTRRPLTLALRAIQPGKGRWVAQGRPVPTPRKPKRRAVHPAALLDDSLPRAKALRVARNDRKRKRQAA
jgi:hypothetical protein